MGGNQFFEFTKNQEVRMTGHCLDYAEDSNTLQMYVCHKSMGNQEWHFNYTSNQIMKKDYNKCLSIKLPDVVIMEECNDTSLFQKWIFKYMYKEKLLAQV
jgi:predicted patatin/cPLA2 family phospholipase